MDIKEHVFLIAKNARDAMSAAAGLSSAEKDEALVEMAEQLIHHMDYLIEENEKDVEYARKKGLSQAMIDRLTLTRKPSAESPGGSTRWPPCPIPWERSRPCGGGRTACSSAGCGSRSG